MQLFIPANTIHIHTHNTRHATAGGLHVPLLKTNFSKSAFSFWGSSLWNTLPAEAHSGPLPQFFY